MRGLALATAPLNIEAMSADVNSDPIAAGFSGLRRLVPSLPSRWYFDTSQYALELERVWARNWIYLCRAESIPAAGCYRTFTIGTQPILLVRDESGELRAFYNTVDTAAHCSAPSRPANCRRAASPALITRGPIG